MMVGRWNFLLKWSLLGGHVNFWGGYGFGVDMFGITLQPRHLRCGFRLLRCPLCLLCRLRSFGGSIQGRPRKVQKPSDGSKRLLHGCFWFPWKVVGDIYIYNHPEGNRYKWYISGIYCQLGDYISPTTYQGNQETPLIYRGHYMVVSLNGGSPNLHPKMIIFSRKTHGFVGETHHFRKSPYGNQIFAHWKWLEITIHPSSIHFTGVIIWHQPKQYTITRWLAHFVGESPT